MPLPPTYLPPSSVAASYRRHAPTCGGAVISPSWVAYVAHAAHGLKAKPSTSKLSAVDVALGILNVSVKSLTDAATDTNGNVSNVDAPSSWYSVPVEPTI